MEPCEKHEMWGCVYCTPTGTITIHEEGHGTRPKGSPWTSLDVRALLDPENSLDDLPALLGRTPAAIRAAAIKYGRHVPKVRRQNGSDPRAQREWTDFELGYLQAHQGEDPEEIARHLGRTPGGVKQRIGKIRRES